MLKINVRERGTVPRKMKKVFNASKKEAWHDTAVEFHAEYRDRRFTEQHATAAGYTRRKGEGQAFGSKAWRASYTGKKHRMFGHTRPLEFSGESRRAARQVRVSSTSKGSRAAYAGLRKFNFRHPKSQIRMGEEFRRILPREADELAKHFDRALDQHLKDADK